MSNESFLEKKRILSEANFEKLSINEEWQPSNITQWDADLIDARAKKLLSDFIHFYPY
jgi:hypothetical protein